jgi:hypothetical protein
MHASGARFEAMWAVHITFGAEGMPDACVFYITPIEAR